MPERNINNDKNRLGRGAMDNITYRINYAVCWSYHVFVGFPVMLIALPMMALSHIDDNKDKYPWNNLLLRLFLYLILAAPFVCSGCILLITLPIWYGLGELIEDMDKKVDVKVPFLKG